MTPLSEPQPRLSVTSLSQYIRLENCDRYLRFRLRPDEEKALLKKWGLTIQPLTPLLQDSGASFEEDVAGQIAARGERVVDLTEKDLSETVKELRDVRAPTILLHASLEAQVGPYPFHGTADVIRAERDRRGSLDLMIADIKASRRERMEHRLQVATYAYLVRVLAEGNGMKVSRLTGTVLAREEEGGLPQLDPDAPSFDLATYLKILERLVIAPDSLVKRIADQPFDQVSYHLNYRCDGCLYNAICMYDSAERLDLSLVPYLTAVEKRVLRASGLFRLPDLATLMDLPTQKGQNELQVPAARRALYQKLSNQWPVGPNLPLIVQRARRALYRFDKSVTTTPFLYGGGFGTLPSDDEHPELIKIFFDAQYDYLEDRVYLVSSLVKGPQGERSIIQCTEAPPTDETERVLLVAWVINVLKAAVQVAKTSAAPIHLYCYNRYDQKVLLEALKRHLDHVSALPPFFDLMTQSPALDQSMISFLSDELAERQNLGLVCMPLHDAARALGFDWSEGGKEYFRIFRARLFDNRRDMLRERNGSLVHVQKETPKDEPRRVTIEAASRFNSQIPLEYAYGAWSKLPADREDDRILEPFRAVTLDQLKAFASHRARALAHIETSFRFKARGILKPPLNLPAIAQAAIGPASLARSMEEFLFMEHHAALQSKLLNYSLPIERRTQTGLALLLKHTGRDRQTGAYRFAIDVGRLGLDPVLTMNAFRLKEGDWVVVNPADPPISAGRIKHGRIATIASLGTDSIELDLKGITFPNGRFRYFHQNRIEPQLNQLYTLDERADDLNADKQLEALRNCDNNFLYQALLSPPEARSVPSGIAAASSQFADLVKTIEKKNAPTLMQREVIANQLDKPLFLVQGPPGTGKSHTLGWAVLCRLATNTSLGRPFRVAVSCKTHNAVNIVLGAIVQKWRKLTGFSTSLTRGLGSLRVYKLTSGEESNFPEGVTALDYYNEKGALESVVQQPLVVIGGTPGGLYNLAKYRAAGGKSVDWTLRPFDLLVIDEASQMSLPEAILASAFLKPNGTEIVVGDHRQMPPIIAHSWGDEQRRSATTNHPYLSLFESLMERGLPRVALDESFRLHETIAKFLGDNIYSLDSIQFFSRRKELLTAPPPNDRFVELALSPQYPIVVIEHGEHVSQQYNETEVELIAPLINVCANSLRLDGRDGVGVVVPHRAQKAMLRGRFPDLAVLESIDTVERFQGGERDVIIVSATASDPDYVLGEADFLLNLNRLNVALSRPRKKLIVVASRSVVDLLTSDLDVFENAIIWKRLYYQWASEMLWQGSRCGVPVWLRGKKAN